MSDLHAAFAAPTGVTLSRLDELLMLLEGDLDAEKFSRAQQLLKATVSTEASRALHEADAPDERRASEDPDAPPPPTPPEPEPRITDPLPIEVPPVPPPEQTPPEQSPEQTPPEQSASEPERPERRAEPRAEHQGDNPRAGPSTTRNGGQQHQGAPHQPRRH
jgi:outer membrane biosynthesis protein TonB